MILLTSLLFFSVPSWPEPPAPPSQCLEFWRRHAREATEAATAATGGILGALWGASLTRFSTSEINHALQLREEAMGALTGPLHDLQAKAGVLRETYREYYEYHANDQLRKILIEKIEPARLSLANSMRSFYLQWAASERAFAFAIGENRVSSSLAAIVRRSDQSHIEGLLKELRASLAAPHTDRLTQEAYTAIRDGVEDLDRAWDDGTDCSAQLTEPGQGLPSFKTRRAFLRTGVGAVGGALIGWGAGHWMTPSDLLMAFFCQPYEWWRKLHPPPPVAPIPLPRPRPAHVNQEPELNDFAEPPLEAPLPQPAPPAIRPPAPRKPEKAPRPPYDELDER